MPGASRAVVVAGGGLAGWVTAVAAAEAGARVTLLEKMAEPGGSTVLSGGFLALAGTPFQRERRIEDSAELLEEDLLAVGDEASDPELVHAYAAGQDMLLRWLLGHGLRVEDVELSSGQSVPRSHRTDPRAFLDALRRCGQDLGVDFRPSTPLVDLRVDNGAGVVAARTPAGEVPADAVVVATGGFSRSEELIAAHAPGQARALRMGGAGNTGDGLSIGLAAGADARDFEHVKGTFGTHPSAGPERHEILLSYYLGGIIVNDRGERFVDESLSYKLIGDAALAQQSPVAFQVFDQAVLDQSPEGVPLFDPRPMLRRGLLLEGATLDELAARAALPPARLRETVSAYCAVARGTANDPLGRTNLVGTAGRLVPLEHPPFYAFPSTTALLATYCGLTVDARARVLDTMGRPIRGLWAVGEVMGGFHGAAYMTGSSLGKAAYFGIVAGRDAAATEEE